MVCFCSSIGINPMLFRELSRRNPVQAAVWPYFVVVPGPLSDVCSGLGQGLKPLLFQAIVTKLPIKALDVAVLHGASWLNQDMPHAMRSCPSHKSSTRELTSVVCTYSQWVASEDRSLVQQSSHVLA